MYEGFLYETSEKDWQKFSEWCDENSPHTPGKKSSGEKYYKVFRDKISPRLTGKEKDPYYWIKEGFEAFVEFIKSYAGSGSTEKKFKKIFGGEVYEQLVTNKDKLPPKYLNLDAWMSMYQKCLDKGMNEDKAISYIVNNINKILEQYGCYSIERKKQIEEGSEIVMQKDGWTVVKIYNYPASEYYGFGSGWCTTGHYNNATGKANDEQGEEYFNKYMSEINQKDSRGKYYLMYLNTDGRKYNCLNYNGGNTWVGTKGKDTKEELPDDIPITPKEVFNGEY